MMNDIQSLDDIKLMVDQFYTTVRQDAILGPIFDAKLEGRWPAHLEKMYRFWQTVLLEEHTYVGSPFVPHATLPVHLEHFNQWLALFYSTVDALFEGPKATRAKWQGQRMAEMFHSKIEYYRHNKAIPII